MSPWQKSLLVFVGAGVGANLRYWLGVLISDRWGATFPWATLVINMSGSALLGAFLGLAVRERWHEGLVLLVAVGVLGGYTTFSTFSVEAIQLLESKSLAGFTWYVLGSCALSLLGAWAGMRLTSIPA